MTRTFRFLASGTSLGALLLAHPARAAFDPTTAKVAQVQAEITRATAAEAGLLPKSGGTLTGPLTLAADPTSAMQAATQQYVLAHVGSSSGSYSPAGQDLGAGTALATGSATPRTFAARAADAFNVRNYGAVGNGSSTAIGTTFGANLAAVAGYTVGGATPFSWMTNPAFGLTFSMATSVDQGGAGTTLTFLETLTGINNWQASVALWQDPGHGNYLVQPGMLVTDAQGVLAAGTTVASVNRTPGTGYGTITLSTASTANVPSGDVITFTIAPTQLQALTVDWLGIQSAFAAAARGTGGTVYGPDGDYFLNHSVINPGGIVDNNRQMPNIDFHGDGIAETRLNFASDVGQDTCAILSGGRGAGNASLSTYHDFRILGPAVARTIGAAPSAMDGVCVGESDRVASVRVDQMHAGFNVVKDHQLFDKVAAANNLYGVYFAPYSSTIGNQLISDSSLVGNTLASVAVATTNQIDASTIRNTGTGFGPYGFYAEANPSNVGQQIGGFLTNTVFDNVAAEAVGNSWIFGVGQSGAVLSDTFTGGGYMDVGGQTSYAVAGGSLGGIYVNEFNNNTMVSTAWSPYSAVTNAIVNVGDNCQYNVWHNDYQFVFNATTSVAPLKCGGNKSKDEFFTGQGDGLLHQVGANFAAGAAVQDNGYVLYTAYTNGTGFAGITATAASNGQVIGILTHADFLQNVLKADSTQAIAKGQPIFVTAGGVAGGMDQDGAIGVAVSPSGAGTTTIALDLDAGMKAGSTGITLNATAAGTTQATAYAITKPSTQFTTVASNAGAILGVVPIGKSISVYNDGANPLLVYPQVGGTIGTGAANAAVSVAAGASMSFRRLSTTLWH